MKKKMFALLFTIGMMASAMQACPETGPPDENKTNVSILPTFTDADDPAPLPPTKSNYGAVMTSETVNQKKEKTFMKKTGCSCAHCAAGM